MKRMPSGFIFFDALKDSQRNLVRVETWAGDLRRCWLACGAELGFKCEPAILTRAQARRLARALTKFADGATKKKKGKKS